MANETRIRARAVKGNLGANYTAGSGTINLGAALPSDAVPTSSQYLPICVGRNILYVTGTATSGTNYPVTGGMEGSTDANATSGDAWAHGPLPSDIIDQIYPRPGAPKAASDEFPGTSLDAKWTSPITTTRATTVTVADGLCHIKPNDAGGVRGGYGIRQAAPSGAFTITAKVWMEPSNFTNAMADDSRLGIFMANSGSGACYIAGIQPHAGRAININNLTYSETADWSASGGVDDFPIVSSSLGLISVVPEHFRIRYDGAGTIHFDWSWDGRVWISDVASSRSLSSPDRIGLAIWGNGGSFVSSGQGMAAEYFRVT